MGSRAVVPRRLSTVGGVVKQILDTATVGEAPPDDGVVEPGMVVTVELFGDEETFLLGSREIADGSDSIDVYSEQSPLGAAIAAALLEVYDGLIADE